MRKRRSFAAKVCALSMFGLAGCSDPSNATIEGLTDIGPRATVLPTPAWTIAADDTSSVINLWNPYSTSMDTLWLTVRDDTGAERFDASGSIGCEYTGLAVCSIIGSPQNSGTKSALLVSVSGANAEGQVRAILQTSGATKYSAWKTYRMQAIASITISPLAPNVPRGSSQQFTSSVLDHWGASVGAKFPSTYSSSNANVGIITSAGLFTANGCGTTTITVQRIDGFTNPTASTVASVTSRCVASLSLASDSGNFEPGTTRQYAVSGVLDNSGASWPEKIASATWSSSNPSAISISSSDLATANAVGSSTLTATIEGITHSVSATVYPTLNVGIYGPRKVVLTASSGCDFQADVSGGSGSGYTYQWYRDGAYIGTSSSVSNVYFDDYFDVALSVKDSAGNRKTLRYWLSVASGIPTAGCYDFGMTTASGSPP